MAISKKWKPYIVVLSAGLFFLFEFINMNSFNPLNEPLRQAFNVNALQVSNLSAMYFYANVIFLIPAGLLLDRFSTKRLLQLALIFCILGNLAFASTHSFMVAKICRFIVGMGSTFCLLSTALLISRWIRPREAGFMMGLVVILAMLGGTLAQQIPHLINLLGSWRYAIAAITGLGVVFLGVISLGVQDYPDDYSENADHKLQLMGKGFFYGLILAMKNKQVWLGGLYTSFINLTVLVIGALWGIQYLQVAQHQSPTHAGSIVTFIFIGLIVGSPLFGFISDKIGRRKLPMILGGLLNLICILIILYLPLSYHQLIVAFFLLGLFSASQILTYPLIMESVPAAITASSESVSAVLIMGGGALFQPLFGYILDRVSHGNNYDLTAFTHAMLILPITFLLATLFACFVRETHCIRLGGKSI